MAKILVVEDDETMRITLRYILEREGHETLTSSDGIVGLDLARGAHPDLIILDLMLPSLDGLSLCRILRRESNVPVIMLTARHEEMDRIVGLEMGADDYVVKPFSMGELSARVRAALRRAIIQEEGLKREVFNLGSLRVDTGSRRAYRDNIELDLAQKELDLLVCLMRNRGIALSRDLLLDRVWGFDFIGDPRTVDVHIRWLREKVEPDPSAPEYIQTVRGIGYRLDAPPPSPAHGGAAGMEGA